MAYGEPRFTNDIDIVADIKLSHVDVIVSKRDDFDRARFSRMKKLNVSEDQYLGKSRRFHLKRENIVCRPVFFRHIFFQPVNIKRYPSLILSGCRPAFYRRDFQRDVQGRKTCRESLRSIFLDCNIHRLPGIVQSFSIYYSLISSLGRSPIILCIPGSKDLPSGLI